MAFPLNPNNGQTTIINGVTFAWNSAKGAWTRAITEITGGGNVSISGNLIPNANLAYDLGTETYRFRSLYLSGNTIDLAGATIKTDSTTGAIALIPQATVANPNPTGIVISPTGTLTTVATVSGTLTTDAFSSASNSAVSSNSTTFSNVTVSTTANLGNVITTGGVFWANGTSALSATADGVITMNQPSTLIVPFTGNARFYPTRTINLKTVYANLGAAPTGANLGFTILKNGSNIGYAFTITTSSATMTPVDISSSTISLTTSDYLTLNLTGNIAPQTLSASDLSVKITYS